MHHRYLQLYHRRWIALQRNHRKRDICKIKENFKTQISLLVSNTLRTKHSLALDDNIYALRNRANSKVLRRSGIHEELVQTPKEDFIRILEGARFSYVWY